ncbi:hypothetical protein AB0I77_11490 [Streptomyces sp. NPDC050619]|uniref:hypothetical protein n=1 Tax=Streptomyces sp. NPDC050619 TaxID=3157214 RepID=UPI003414027D
MIPRPGSLASCSGNTRLTRLSAIRISRPHADRSADLLSALYRPAMEGSLRSTRVAMANRRP